MNQFEKYGRLAVTNQRKYTAARHSHYQAVATETNCLFNTMYVCWYICHTSCAFVAHAFKTLVHQTSMTAHRQKRGKCTQFNGIFKN